MKNFEKTIVNGGGGGVELPKLKLTSLDVSGREIAGLEPKMDIYF